MFRLVQELQPSWVIGENVSGHIKLGLDTVLKNLESEGYAARTFSISASSIGANHQRERVWIVANSKQDNYFEQVRRRNEEESGIQKKYREEHGQSRQSSGTSEVWKKSNRHENVEDTRQLGGGLEPSGNKESIGRGSYEKTEWSTNADQTSGSSQRGEVMANTSSKRTSRGETRREDAENVGQSSKRPWDGWWDIEPDVGRVAHGVPKRVDRLKSLGNSLVPSIPYYIGLSILQTYEDELANTSE